MGALNDRFDTLGYLIIALFTGTWLVALAVYHLKRYDRIDVVVTPALAAPRTT